MTGVCQHQDLRTLTVMPRSRSTCSLSRYCFWRPFLMAPAQYARSKEMGTAGLLLNALVLNALTKAI